jgi:hypothetical protein
MPSRFDRDLDDLLARCGPGVGAKARELVRVVSDIRPDMTARVRFGWGTVNFTHPTAGYLCAVWPGRDHASLVFANGRLLDHPLLVDDGKVVRVRWIPFAPGDAIPTDDIAILIAESVALRG